MERAGAQGVPTVSKTSETGGLQGTAHNLGASTGAAIIGAVLIVGLTNRLEARIADNPQLPASVRETIALPRAALAPGAERAAGKAVVAA